MNPPSCVSVYIHAFFIYVCILNSKIPYENINQSGSVCKKSHECRTSDKTISACICLRICFQNAKKLVLIHAAHNQLVSLPKDLKQMASLESLYFYGNNIKSLEGALQKSRRLMRIGLSFNKIEFVSIITKLYID